MIRLLQFLIFGHAHKWVEDSRNEIRRGKEGFVIGVFVTCRCETCGRPKSWTLKVSQ